MLKNYKLENKPKYYLNAKSGQFCIENYNFSRPFADFFPGIAGKYGIPMWAFFVNRAQAIASFGTKDKDQSILEFFPANKSWQLASSRGFRTFLKLKNGSEAVLYEPFSNASVNSSFNLKNRMDISSYDLRLKEENASLGIEITVEYFTIPNDTYAALARIVTLKNTKKEARKIQLLDGLPQIVPFGTTNLFLKKLGRTIEAWMGVKNLEKNAPFYKLAVDPADRPEVIHIREGNFYLGLHYEKNKPIIIRPIVDPDCIFGPFTDFSFPYQFLQKDFSEKKQIAQNKTPCGFSSLDLTLAGKEEKTLYSLVGYMRNQEALNSSLKRITAPGYFSKKREENKKIIQELQADINTDSGYPEFNLYAKQTYLDNIIRGGYPVIFNHRQRPAVFYLYSRKHGDLERDYNKFQIQPAYFSQGNGNYRDINQNRRCDIWFNPEMGEENIITFFNLLQADGFNPLVVKGVSFLLEDIEGFKSALKDKVKDTDILSLLSFLGKPFTPGEAVLFLQDNKIKSKTTLDELLGILLSHCVKEQEAEHGEGFWTDHWTYNLDLLESYLALYPEKSKELIFEKRVFTFYDNTETVKPRHEKYVLKAGKVKQLHAVIPDQAKREMIKKRHSCPHLVREQYGIGNIYRTTLINKLLCLLANKVSSLDPCGVGIEMEADKPNWFDALNGLPALFGSSICETMELKRLAAFIKEALEKTGIGNITLTDEVGSFLFGLEKLIEEYLNSGSPDKDYLYWDQSASLKEEYRHKTKLGFSGTELETDASKLIILLDLILKKLDLGLEKAYDKKNKLYYAYFINEVKEYSGLSASFVKPTGFAQIKLPLFLAAQMHALRQSGNTPSAKGIYESTRKSVLFDKKLRMYKVTAPLADMPEEIGRCRVFTPGWLENESIWLHMEYKYLLEVLKCGLYSEFYQEFKNLLIPFQKPERYGRSTLENSSFLVSSAFPDKNLQGNGFVARLSGSTAEFIQIWLIMHAGLKPFILDDKGRLNLCLKPVLARWLFKKDNTYSFNFLGKIKVTYSNPKRKDTFGPQGARITHISFKDKEGNLVTINSDTIPSPYAGQVRLRQIKDIEAYLQ